MREIIARDSPFSCEVVDRDDGEDAVRRQGRNLQARADRRHPRRRRDQDLLAARMARPLPRPAHDLDRQGRQGLQAVEDRRRLLARGFDKPDAPAHLRHGLGQRRRPQGLSASARRGREARPSPLGPRDGPVPLPGRGARCRVLASEGLGAVPGADRLYAPAPAGLGLCRGELPRHARPRAVGAVGPLGEVRREHVHHRDAGRARLLLQADELPRPCADLQAWAEELSRSAVAHRRIRQGASLRAVGGAAWAAARASLHAGRRAYLLHRGSDHRGMREAERADAVDLSRLRL